MKKRIFFLVVLSTLILSCISVFAKSYNSEKSRVVLNYIGVMEAEEESSKHVTRAEFTNYMFKALKAVEVKNRHYFNDVPDEYWASVAINTLTDYGIISYASDGMFNPNAEITYEQACKILVYALGYEALAQVDKLGMNAYVSIINDLGIDADIENYSHITTEEAANLIYLAMSTPVAEKQGANGMWSIKINEDGKTLFDIYFDVYFGEGQVTAVYGLSMEDADAFENEAYIENESFTLSENVDVKKFFGEDVVYAYIEDKNEDKTLIYAEAKKEDTRITINSDNIKSIKGSLLEYYPEGSTKSKNLTFDAKADVLFNGKTLKGNIEEKINELIAGKKTGKVEFVKTKDSEYDLIIIESYEGLLANTYNEDENIVYGKEKNIDLDNYKHIVVLNSLGSVSTMPKSYPCVLMVSESEDKETIEIVVCNIKKQINVSSISEDYIYDGETEYKVSEYAKSNTEFDINAGGTYSIYLDMFGNICHITSESDSMKIGWVRRTIVGESDNSEVQVLFQIFEYDANTTLKYTLAENVEVDGVRYKIEDINKLLLAFPGETKTDANNNLSGISPQLIRFVADENSKIVKIDTTNIGKNEDAKNTLREIERGVRHRSSADGWMGMKILYANSNTVTKKMTVAGADCPDLVTGNQEPKDAYYQNTYTLKDGSIPVIAYMWSDESLYADMMVFPIDGGRDNYDIYMFAGLTKKIANDGEVITVAEAYGNGQKKEFEVETDECLAAFSTLNKGDLFSPQISAGDMVTNLKKVFDMNSVQFEAYDAQYADPDRFWFSGDPYGGTTGIGQGWFNSNVQMAKGYALSVKGATFSISYTEAGANAGEADMLFLGDNKYFYVYDKNETRGDAVRAATIGDIKDFESCGEDCDILIITSKNYAAKNIFIVRR